MIEEQVRVHGFVDEPCAGSARRTPSFRTLPYLVMKETRTVFRAVEFMRSNLDKACQRLCGIFRSWPQSGDSVSSGECKLRVRLFSEPILWSQPTTTAGAPSTARLTPQAFARVSRWFGEISTMAGDRTLAEICGDPAVVLVLRSRSLIMFLRPGLRAVRPFEGLVGFVVPAHVGVDLFFEIRERDERAPRQDAAVKVSRTYTRSGSTRRHAWA